MERMSHVDRVAMAKLIAEEVWSKLLEEGMAGKYLNVQEACKYVQRSDATIMKWIREGYIRASKTTGQWLIDRDSLNAFIEKGMAY